jgi:hypothetical protein
VLSQACLPPQAMLIELQTWCIPITPSLSKAVVQALLLAAACRQLEAVCADEAERDRALSTQFSFKWTAEDSSIKALAVLFEHRAQHATYTVPAAEAVMATLMIEWLDYYSAGTCSLPGARLKNQAR